jgi:hypothetical protein
MPQKISVSIIVHRQASLAVNLLKDLNNLSNTDLEVLLTVNVAETIPFADNDFEFPVAFIRNHKPEGFGANHNAAFRRMQGQYLCIANPDIRLRENPFPTLTAVLDDRQAAAAAPLIKNAKGRQEDNVRHFPTPASIIAKSLGIGPRIEYPRRTKPFTCEWAAGMFMLFSPRAFSEIGGFDEKYHLYYEDVDICARLKLAGHRIVACPSVSVLHNARRESHQNLRYMKWHLQSMLRFFLSRTYRRVLALRSS